MDEDESPDAELVEEWVRQNNVIYIALIGLGLIMVQPFLTADSLDTSAKICVVAFAVAIPLLAALAMLSDQEEFRHRLSGSRLAPMAKAIAMLASFAGVVAGFWHIIPVAGAAMAASGLVGVFVHSAGYARLESPRRPSR